MRSTHQVTIIVPTMGSADRKVQLARAITSIADATIERTTILVCVNGNRASAESIVSIEAVPGVAVHKLAEPSLQDQPSRTSRFR